MDAVTTQIVILPSGKRKILLILPKPLQINMDIKKLGAEELRVVEPTEEQLKEVNAYRQEIYIVLDNALDT